MRKAENCIVPLALVAVVICGAFAAHLIFAPQPVATTVLTQQSDSDKLDINTATAEELETLPKIGPVLAQRILDHRAEHGPFVTIGQLLDVPGIGEKTLESIAPYITAGGTQ